VNVFSGIGPFDERVGGFRDGGLYLIAGGPGSGKLTFLLQALERGVQDGERVALVSGASPLEILDEAEYWGLDLRTPWKQGRCILIGFRGEFSRRVVHTPDPGEAFAELSRLLDGPVARLAIDPGTFVWDTRAGPAMAQLFLEWIREMGATTLATIPEGLDEGHGPSTEWVVQRAQGVFQIARHPRGLHELKVERMMPPVDEPGPISLELVPGAGFGAPSGRFDRRRGGARPDSRRLLLVRLTKTIPSDLEGWLGKRFDVEVADDPLRAIARLQSHTFGAVCVYSGRERADDAVETCRTVRAICPAVLLLLSDEPLRAVDTARALDAGCDDVLSGSVDLRELESRLRRATESARRQPAQEREPPPASDGPLDDTEFTRLVSERLISEGLEHFSILLITAPTGDDVAGVLYDSVRADQGDLVGRVRRGWGVLLQDARAQQAEVFLQRLRDSLAENGSAMPLSAEILAAPEQSERIRAMLGD
jgi:DNA-binding response OmpR family regulator